MDKEKWQFARYEPTELNTTVDQWRTVLEASGPVQQHPNGKTLAQLVVMLNVPRETLRGHLRKAIAAGRCDAYLDWTKNARGQWRYMTIYVLKGQLVVASDTAVAQCGAAIADIEHTRICPKGKTLTQLAKLFNVNRTSYARRLRISIKIGTVASCLDWVQTANGQWRKLRVYYIPDNTPWPDSFSGATIW